MLPPGRPRPRILDLGTGCGVNAQLLGRFGDAVLVDRSRDALEFARTRVPGPACRADARRLPFRDGTFDLAVALDLLEHLEDDVGGLAELARVLAPGGRLLVMVPAFPVLWGPQDESSRHHRRYRKGELVARTRAAGLRVERAWFFNFALFLPILAARRAIRLLGLRIENENEINGPLRNRFFASLFGAEARLSHLAGYPFGVSLGMVAGKSLDH